MHCDAQEWGALLLFKNNGFILLARCHQLIFHKEYNVNHTCNVKVTSMKWYSVPCMTASSLKCEVFCKTIVVDTLQSCTVIILADRKVVASSLAG